MNYKKTIAAIALIALAACNGKDNRTFTVKGNIKNCKGNKVYLQELPLGAANPILLDSTSIDASGNFLLKTGTFDENMYLVSFKMGPDVLVINDVPELSLKVDVNQFKTYTTEGSAATKSLHSFLEDYSNAYSPLMKTMVAIDSAGNKEEPNEKLNDSLETKRVEQLQTVNQLIDNYCSYSKSPAAVCFGITTAFRTKELLDIKALSDKALKQFSGSGQLLKLSKIIAAQIEKSPTLHLIDKQAPEITVKDTADKSVSLSSFKGKYVLLDFWASWCRPCRAENPNVRKAYQHFKDKNLTIVGVSLDSVKYDWMKAIHEDSLTWNHISDLKQWESNSVKTYQVEAIPFNLLIDPKGKVLATNLKGEALLKKLGEVLK